jgi:hypothetical protein
MGILIGKTQSPNAGKHPSFNPTLKRAACINNIILNFQKRQRTAAVHDATARFRTPENPPGF